ncbi:MAG: valine--tRNA ligase [Candidatus Omnitrophica bacterium]|nr:valine--tRNA ligase [Candidatus Omnitrophota bacterium]
MIDELSKQYHPKETEDKWYKFWEENNLFSAKANPKKKPFCIVIPPPNVTGILHMGHALNNTIQDILIRYQRLKGRESLWMPGIDHAGIATQNVVEKQLAKEGLKRQDLGREKFIERVWQWKEQYGSTIIKQLKKLGASCDWPRARFTMDEEYSQAVKEVFVALWGKGLIYQDNKVINWCPRCQTALSDEEAPHRELQGNLYYIKYPLKESPSHQVTKSPVEYIIVATTRPETMLGDTAVAVNPKDKRYKHIVGKTLILPLVNREIKIIADSLVDTKFGTGAVKVTPSHDPNDYLLGKKHKLEFVNVMHPDGRMNENAGDYSGLDRFEAREVILEDLKEKNLLEKTEAHQLSAGHCYRCHTIIEPYLSRQWFVKMAPLAKPAIAAVKTGKIKFYPKRWTKVYLNWMENIQDWCISRQIWWGHRIPLWHCQDCQKTAASVDDLKECPVCKSSHLKQDQDVLDTWFSSWLWPFATFGWPFVGEPVSQLASEPVNRLKTLTGKPANRQTGELKYFYPTSVLVTAPEIIFFWVARMIMAGEEFMRDIPFRDVYIHGTVRDIEGKKMSKSLGNIIDPLDIISEYGADALRFSLISITAQGQDVFLSEDRFQQGRNFANKIWNAARFILMNLDKAEVQAGLESFKGQDLGIVNRWILSRFYSVLKETDKMLGAYRFNEAANALYGFFWHEFCDWYLELAKPILVNREQSAGRRNTQIVAYKVLEKFLRVIHPFMPFITEEIWQKLQFTTSQSHRVTSIMTQAWPSAQEEMMDKAAEAKLNLIFQVITTIRNMRQELELAPEKDIEAVIAASGKAHRDFIDSLSLDIKRLAGLSAMRIEEKYQHPRSSITSIIKDVHISILLEGAVDLEKEKIKIGERIEKIELEISAKQRTLANKGFLQKAPAEVIAKEKERVVELTATLKRLKEIRDELH